MDKKSSYQKLKEENLKLKQDIYILVMEEKNEPFIKIMKRFGVRHNWQMRFRLENIIWGNNG